MSKLDTAHSKNIQQRSQERKKKIIKKFFLTQNFYNCLNEFYQISLPVGSSLRFYQRSLLIAIFKSAARKEQEFITTVNLRTMLIFSCQITSNRLQQKKTPKQKQEGQSLSFQTHTNFSQKLHKGDKLELSWTQEKGKPWKRKLMSYTVDGLRQPTQVLKERGEVHNQRSMPILTLEVCG